MFRLALCCIPFSKLMFIGLLLVGNAAVWGDDQDNPPVPLSAAELQSGSEAALRVALVDSGVNYLLPDILSGLARDVDGNLVGYDFWDMDELPFDSHPGSRGPVQRHGTRTASILLREAPFVKLVSYRYPRPDMSRMADLLAHASANDVRVIGLPLGGNQPEQWAAFEAAAKQYPQILFVASAGNNGRDIDQVPVYPAALTLENMLVVTSADDFAQVADGVNWGRSSVDYMVPAEALMARRFNGSEALVAGSSYAVPRVVALAARYLRDERSLTALELIQRIRHRFANGTAPRQLAQGYLFDPQFDETASIAVAQTYPFDVSTGAVGKAVITQEAAPSVDSAEDTLTDVQGTALDELTLPLQVLVLDKRWRLADVKDYLQAAQDILAQCTMVFSAGDIEYVQGPDYLRDLEAGAARTLMDAVRLSGPDRRLSIIFARDTLMRTAFDAEAFGRGNTRQRPWMTDSVWLTLALEDRAIALAHEMFHVLVNSGQHSDVEGSLMLARTTGSNTALSDEDCLMARQRSLSLGLARRAEAR